MQLDLEAHRQPVLQDPVGQRINRDILDQQAAAYVEAIRLQMIA